MPRVNDLTTVVGLETTNEVVILQGGVVVKAPLSILPFLQSGTGAVADSSQNKHREVKSLMDWMTAAQKTLVRARTGYSASDRTAMLASITAAWTAALANDHDIYAPSGLYEIGEANFPWTQSGTPGSLLDCANTTIYCEGPGTEFKTVSVNGADVFQLNGLKNFHVRGFPKLTATISGSTSGSNGVSITNGFDNVTLEVYCENLASVDATTNVDGGKALSVQPPSSGSLVCGSLKATVRAKGCAQGFGVDFDPDFMEGTKVSIDVDLYAEDCYQAVGISNAAATGALTAGKIDGLRVRGQAVNCQRDVVIGRARGVDIDIQIQTTKTAAARRLDPNSVAWLASDTVVEALYAINAISSSIKVIGNKGACDYKMRIGGASDASSGLTQTTYNSHIHIDVAGTAATADISSFTDGTGIASTANTIYISPATTSSIPAAVKQANSVWGNSDGVWAAFPTAPTLAGSITAGAQTYAAQVGRYCRVGNVVFFTIVLSLSAKDAATSGNLSINNLPFTSRNVSGGISSVTFNYIKDVNLDVAGGYYTVVGRILNNDTAVQLQEAGDNNSPANLSDVDIGAATAIWCSGFYEV